VITVTRQGDGRHKAGAPQTSGVTENARVKREESSLTLQGGSAQFFEMLRTAEGAERAQAGQVGGGDWFHV
jgi:hypothetical protein